MADQKINELPVKTAPVSGDKVLISGASEEYLIDYDDFGAAILSGNTVEIYNNSGFHNSIFRGKNLGTSVTSEQYQNISNGSFKDLYIGDYWVINGIRWRIAAFDYYYNCGDTNFAKHHVVIVPDSSLYSYQMNNTDTTEGGYAGSKMYTEGLTEAKATIESAFGASHVLSHRIYLINGVTSGRSSSGAWYDSKVDLMCENMVYGGMICSPMASGTVTPSNYRVEHSQLPLFRLDKQFVNRRYRYWLRDVVSSASFAKVGSYGDAYYDGASNSYGVRPFFCIGI